MANNPIEILPFVLVKGNHAYLVHRSNAELALNQTASRDLYSFLREREQRTPDSATLLERQDEIAQIVGLGRQAVIDQGGVFFGHDINVAEDLDPKCRGCTIAFREIFVYAHKDSN